MRSDTLRRAVRRALARAPKRARKWRQRTSKFIRTFKLRKRRRRVIASIQLYGRRAGLQLRKRTAHVHKRARHLRLSADGVRVRVSYHAHRFLLANRSSRTSFLRAQPLLTPLQTRLVEELRRDGVAATNFHALVADADLWRELCGDIGAFAAGVAAGLPNRAAPRAKADYLIRRHNTAESRTRGGPWCALSESDPWVRLGVRPEILDVVNAYRGLWTKYLELDQCYTVPFGNPHGPIGAQNWHRDDGDLGLVTVFVYFSDIDEDAGPFQYVTGSHAGGPLARLWRWTLFGQRFIAAEEVGRRIPDGAWRTMTGPAGLIVFADSSGMHRGGLARVNPRIMSYHVYASPAAPRSSLRARTFAIGRLPAEVSDAATFALS
jgi:Phytanoyl-CoA dioxygenase (PhyH)